jgi:cytochrome P450
MHVALEVVGHALFGTDLSTEAHRLTRSTLDALDVVVARARVPVTPPDWLPTPANRRLHAAVGSLDEAVGAIMAERRGRTPDEPDMLDLLISSTDDTGAHLTTTEVRNQAVTFIVAGHETAASALAWAWGLLAQHPDVQARLQQESDEVLGGRAPTFADYARLPVARAVIDETLRLYPPAWLITRKSLGADVLGGHDVPSGALIILSPWLLHRHPAVWPEPERFLPQRFLDGTADRVNFVPFGAGLRQCIGRDFAYVESTLVLATIAGRYRMEFPAGTRLPAGDPLVTIRPRTGMPLRVRRR